MGPFGANFSDEKAMDRPMKLGEDKPPPLLCLRMHRLAKPVHTYASDDPVNVTDPSGAMSCFEAMALALIDTIAQAASVLGAFLAGSELDFLRSQSGYVQFLF